MKKVIAGCLAGLAMLSMVGCIPQAEVASQNLTKAADNFELNRRTTFYDARQGVNILAIEGRCSIEFVSAKQQLVVTCKTGPNEFKKHFLGKSDSVTYVSEQLEPVTANVYRHRVIFRPSLIIPDVELDLGI